MVAPINNRQLVATAMKALADGDGGPFLALMADDFSWVIEGSTLWSGTYRGKADVSERLLGPLFGQFATRYRNTAELILADGDHVVVQCRGEAQTRSGKRYDNSYCYVIRMRDGKMAELREYLDTALVEAALEPPGQP